MFIKDIVKKGLYMIVPMLVLTALVFIPRVVGNNGLVLEKLIADDRMEYAYCQIPPDDGLYKRSTGSKEWIRILKYSH